MSWPTICRVVSFTTLLDCAAVWLFFFFLAPGLSAKKSSPRAGKKKRKSEDHLPMVIGEWESEIEAVADT